MPATTHVEQTTLQQAAVAYAEHDVAIFPVVPRGKLPLLPRCEKIEGTHKPDDCGGGHGHGLHDATTDVETVRLWWDAHPDANIGVALGVNGLFALDVDGPDGRAALDKLEAEHGELPATYQVVTGRAEGHGRHHIYRQPADGPPIRNRMLDTKLETRGDGGYVVAPPSIHSSGRPYLAEGSWAQITDPPLWLVELATARREPAPTPAAQTVTGRDEVAIRRLVGLAGRLAMMGADTGRNNALNHAAHTCGRLIAADRLDRDMVEDTLTTAAYRCGLDQDPDCGPRGIANTIRSGIEAGLLEPDHTGVGGGLDVPAVTTVDRVMGPPQTDAPTTTSPWAPMDVADILSGDYVPPETTTLARTDGMALLYPGSTNAIFGESESGKSWVALHATAQLLNAGRSAVYIDFEATAPVIINRLVALGVPAQAILDHLAYINPDTAIDAAASMAITDTLEALRPELVVLDGVTGAMGIHGWDPLNNADAEKFDRLLPRSLAAAGPAVLMVDHVPKSREADVKYAMGAQHKRAAITGAAYRVDVIHTLAPGRAGALKLTISKDRHGTVRAANPVMAGVFHLDATDPEHPRARVEPPAASDKPFRPTALMERVSRFLEVSAEPVLKRDVVPQVTGRNEYVGKALDVLVAEGYVERKLDGTGHLHTSIKPYRDEEMT